MSVTMKEVWLGGLVGNNKRGVEELLGSQRLIHSQTIIKKEKTLILSLEFSNKWRKQLHLTVGGDVCFVYSHNKPALCTIHRI